MALPNPATPASSPPEVSTGSGGTDSLHQGEDGHPTSSTQGASDLGKAQDPRPRESTKPQNARGPVAILPRDPMPVGPQITNRDRAACLLPSEASGHQTPARFDVWLLQRDQIPVNTRGEGRVQSLPDSAARQPSSRPRTACSGDRPTHARTAGPSRTRTRAQAPAPDLAEAPDVRERMELGLLRARCAPATQAEPQGARLFTPLQTPLSLPLRPANLLP